MRKMLSVMLLLGASVRCLALPIGNPAEPTLFAHPCTPSLFDYPLKISNIGIGYYGDFVYNRHLHNDIPSTIRQTQIFTNAGYLVVNFCDRFDLFGTVGATRFDITTFGDSLKATGSTGGGSAIQTLRRQFKLKSDVDLSLSIGGRVTILEWCCFGLGVEAQYFYTNPDLAYINTATYLARPDDVSMKYREWQAGMAAYYRIDLDCQSCSAVVPYVGIKWSHANLDMGDATLGQESRSAVDSTTLVDCESAKSIGFAIGLSAVFCHHFALCAEGRFADEKALYVNGQFRF